MRTALAEMLFLSGPGVSPDWSSMFAVAVRSYVPLHLNVKSNEKSTDEVGPGGWVVVVGGLVVDGLTVVVVVAVA
jgi:hypothetical protein